MWEAIATIVKELIDLGRKPSRDEVLLIAAAVAKDEFVARVMADELDVLIRAANKVQSAFDAKPGEVPILELDVEIVKPE